MSQNKTIIDIEKDFERRKRFIVIYSFLVISILISGISYSYLQNELYKAVAILISFGSLVLFGLTIIFYSPPYLTPYILIQYHINKLLDSLLKKDYKKSKHHLDKTAYNILKFEEELQDLPVLKSVENIFSGLFDILKYQIYPDLLERNPIDSHDAVLISINSALYHDNTDSLSQIVEDAVGSGLEPNASIVLPFEKRRFNWIINTLKIKVGTLSFIDNIYIKFVSISILLLIVISIFFTIDATLMAAIITSSAILSKGINK